MHSEPSCLPCTGLPELSISRTTRLWSVLATARFTQLTFMRSRPLKLSNTVSDSISNRPISLGFRYSNRHWATQTRPRPPISQLYVPEFITTYLTNNILRIPAIYVAFRSAYQAAAYHGWLRESGRVPEFGWRAEMMVEAARLNYANSEIQFTLQSQHHEIQCRVIAT